MSAWGQDIFENDSAYGELALLLEHIVSNIRQGFTQDAEEWIYGEGDAGEAQIMANIDILYTLCRHYATCPDVELSEVEMWQRQYLATFDRITEQRGTASSDHTPERRRYIKAAFDRLYDLIEDFEDSLQEGDDD
jgi:hypothetical protein